MRLRDAVVTGMCQVVAYDFPVEPEYKSLGFAAGSMTWFKQNWQYLFVIIIIALIITALALRLLRR